MPIITDRKDGRKGNEKKKKLLDNNGNNSKPNNSVGGGGGGGSDVNDDDTGIIRLRLLYKVDPPTNFKITDLDHLKTDFLDELKEMPLRNTSDFVGISNRGNSCDAASVIKMLYRVPVVRKVVANLAIYIQ